MIDHDQFQNLHDDTKISKTEYGCIGDISSALTKLEKINFQKFTASIFSTQ